MQEQATPARMLRVKTVAEMFDVSVSTIYRAIARGLLEAVRVGTGKGAIRIPESALAAFRQACAIAADVNAAGDVSGEVA
jgi:excisionase family DNA binding protein